ncbi:uncharacterized protein LOC108670783 [Hyalella azteca]|uniref:Uncharacterized protein LOC108670783 n=1 Tax=Hyalella azteca TaxID=294128 RepID=A0A8B7NJD7_HYAAZ|nr:uncharacterized protein LOC108670783 [Hyalella azteca]
MLVAFLPFLGWARYSYRSDWCSCGVVWRSSFSYAATWLLLVVLLPLTVTTSCYVRLLRVARNKCRKVNVGTMLGEGQTANAPNAVVSSDLKKTSSSVSLALETLKKLSPNVTQTKLSERRQPSDEGIHSGDSSPLSMTRKSSVTSQDWQLRRSYSNFSQLTPYSRTYVQSSKNDKASGSAEGIFRSCTSQILPYSSLMKNTSLSLHYSPKDHPTEAAVHRGSFYRPKSLHLEHKSDDDMNDSLSSSKKHCSTGELKQIDSNFLHPHMNNSGPIRACDGGSNNAAAFHSKINSQSSNDIVFCSSQLPVCKSLSSGSATSSGLESSKPEHKSQLRKPAADAAFMKSLIENNVPAGVPCTQLTTCMYPGDLPPRRLPKSGSDCTLVIPASHRKYYKMTGPSVRRSCSDAQAVKKV